MIRGTQLSLTHVTSSPTLIVPFETEAGTFYIEVGLSHAEAS